MTTLELTRFAAFKSSLKNRWLQLGIMLVLLGGFLFSIASGLVGTPVGSSNFGIVFVWIAWWAALILVTVPLAGRAWCSVCPIPLPGEWLQRGAVFTPRDRKPRWLNLRWPKVLRGMWLQSAAFLLLALFSVVLLTSPEVTALVLVSMLFAAAALSLIFERRAFCRYLCPVGGFVGLYSQTAPLELRIKDRSRCATCDTKPCFNGSAAGYGCPWGVFPAGLSRNTYCGLCLECLRTCPRDNIAVNLRIPGADLANPSSRLDESFKSFAMLGAALTYSAVLLGPWGGLKDAAFRLASPAWFIYVVLFLALTCLALPGLFGLAVAGSRSTGSFRQRFSRLSAALIPLGLMAWVAFTLTFVLANASYLWTTLSDPLGLGWNLFGTAAASWQPVFASWLAPAQTFALVAGFLWSSRTAQRVAAREGHSPSPVIAFALVFTLAMLWMLL